MAPLRVKPFTWKVEIGSIATKKNKKTITLEISEVCSICGNGTEN